MVLLNRDDFCVHTPRRQGLKLIIQKTRTTSMALNLAARSLGKLPGFQQGDRVDLQLILFRDRLPNPADHFGQIEIVLAIDFMRHYQAFFARHVN